VIAITKERSAASERRSAFARLIPGTAAPLLIAIIATSALSACGRSDDAPGAVSAGEQKALDDAAEMVEGQKLDPAAIPSTRASNAPTQPPAATPPK